MPRPLYLDPLSDNSAITWQTLDKLPNWRLPNFAELFINKNGTLHKASQSLNIYAQTAIFKK